MPTPPRHASHLPADYLPHVDGLRALAVALVVIYHAWPSAIPGGFIGVDVFFVISGFIITRQIAREMEGGSFSYAAFLGRRARRLVPAASVCSLLVTAVAAVALMPDALARFSESLAATWTMTANFYFYATSGYFDAPSAEAPLLHMWSLAVEDQFYLTWPLLLLVLVRRLGTRPRLVAAALALGGLSLVHSELMAAREPELAFYLPFSRAFELLSGCTLALALPLLSAPARRTRMLADGVGVALVVGSALAIHAETPFPGLTAVPAIAGSVLLIGAGLFGATPVSRLLSTAPVVLTGRMSYSIYLYHWPALALATYTLGRAPNAVEAAGFVALSLGLAALSWAFVEQRLTQRLGLYEAAPARLLKGTATLAAALTAVALIGVAGRGWPERLDPPAYAVYHAASTGNPLRKSCDGYELAFRNDSYCTFGRARPQGGSYDIAVFGDSNADHFVPMIAALAAEAGLSGRQVTQSACAALIGAHGVEVKRGAETCARYQETILKFLERNPGLKIAVLSSAWSLHRKLRVNHLWPGRETTRTLSFAEAAAETVALFRKRGIKVLIIGQVPFFDVFSLNCLVAAARNDTEEIDCAEPLGEVDQTLDFSQTAFRSLAARDPGVTFLSMRDLLCGSTICSAFKDEVLLYRDSEHLNAIGSAYLARYAALPKLDTP